MSVFRLKSDKQFLRTMPGDPDNIYVFEYMDDPNVFNVIYASDASRWGNGTRIGSSPGAAFRALEVYDDGGVTIEGSKLEELARDLTLVDKTNGGQVYRLLVNRQGLCFLRVQSQSIVWLRINDHFGWSKYGVKPRISTIWSIWDMSNGDVLVGPPSTSNVNGGGDHDGVKVVQKLLEEKEKLLEEKNRLMEKMVAEKEKEVVSLKAALSALSRI